MNPRMTHHRPRLPSSFFLSLLFSLCARARVANLSLSLSLSHEKKISLKKRYSRSVSKYVRVCVFFVRGEKKWLYHTFNGRNTSRKTLQSTQILTRRTKCFPTRGGTDTKTLLFYFFLATTTHKTKLSLSLFERYFFLRIFSVTSHVTRTNTNSNNVFPESAPFVLSLCALTHIYIYIYIVRTTTT